MGNRNGMQCPVCRFEIAPGASRCPNCSAAFQHASGSQAPPTRFPGVSPALAASCAETPVRRAWLDRLPDAVAERCARWNLTLGPPFDGATCSWVAPARRSDGEPVALKLAMPHFEAEQEIDGLRLWNGRGIVRLLEADVGRGAMLLELCRPGAPLAMRQGDEQDEVLAFILRRLWGAQSVERVRPLEAMVRMWSASTRKLEARWLDAQLVAQGLRLFEELSVPTGNEVLLATDLHAGNVLSAEREPWLAIDPKPFVGDPAYDATQHLFNCPERWLDDPATFIERYAKRLGVDPRRVRLWALARAAAEPGASCSERYLAWARALAT